MISKLDDYPVHQTAEPLAQTASSDRFTYDRYWYNGHVQDGSLYFGIALGRYPNLGIMDCGFSVVVNGRQHAFHASCRAPVEPTDTVVGPFALHILEPMGRHRLVIAPNETGIECDLIFTPRTGAIQEGRQTIRNTRHLVQDVTRFDQFGFWHGVIRCEGKEITVDARLTYGLKDRSWGIRPIGERYTGAAPLAEKPTVHFMWAPIHWKNRCTLAGWYEDSDGNQWHTDQAIAPAYESAALIPGVTDPQLVMWRGQVDHQFGFKAGTRWAKTATIRMNDRAGESMEITLEPVLRFLMKGIGYQHPEWGHGAWKGELAVSGESWACDEPDPLKWENMHVQQVVFARCGNEVGYGVLEQVHMGPYRPYGFKGWLDGA